MIRIENSKSYLGHTINLNKRSQANIDKLIYIFENLVDKCLLETKKQEASTKEIFAMNLAEELSNYDMNMGRDDTTIRIHYNRYVDIVIDFESCWRDKKLFDILK